MHLSKEQISCFVEQVGQPRASVLLSRFFQSYCSTLSSADVAELYDDEYARRIAGHEAHLVVDGRYKVNVYNGFSYAYLKQRSVRGKRLLDYGCGDGSFAMASAASLGVSTLGIDFNADLIEAALKIVSRERLNCRFQAGGLEAVPVGEVFDLVTLNDLVEHLSDSELHALFRALRGHLAQNSEVIIHTPNGLALCNDSESSLLQLMYKAYIRIFKGWQGFERTVDQLYYDQVHINIKSFRSLKRLLAECGFVSRVVYDSPQQYSWLDFLSSNMLIIATPAT